MTAAATCQGCGHALRPGARFCDQCGTRVGLRTCRTCGHTASKEALYCSDCGNALEFPIAGRPVTREKRQATVVNLDLVGSTRLAIKLGAEDAHLAVLESIRTIQNVVYRYKPREHDLYDRIEGDSIMFCFGLPLAREDDAERAARSALEAAAAVTGLHVLPGVALRVRVGVATGEVVVEFRPESLTTTKPFITGHAANLAARLRALADPGGVTIADETAHLIETDFDVQSLGVIRLKGVGKIQPWRLLGARAGNRLDALVERSSRVPLVGREQEIGLLLDRWQLALEGLGQVVLLHGEPGVGKSRLLGELYGRIGNRCGAALYFQCAPYYQNSAFYPVIDNLQRWVTRGADTIEGQPLATLRLRLTNALRLPPSTIEIIAKLLAPSGTRHDAPASDLGAQERRDTIEALIDLARVRIATAGSAVLVLEDAQWADPSTLQVVQALISRMANWPLLMIVAHRPEFEAPEWSGCPLTSLALGRLDPSQSATLVARVAKGADTLSRHAIETILQKTDGIPLFIEEVTKAVIESPALRDRFDDKSPTNAAILPTPVTLRELITARLDRSPHAKAVAQVGAVIGREFSDELLGLVLTDPAIDRRQGLEDLREADLLFTRTSSPGTIHAFKHALIQDEARESLLRDIKQDLHGRVARALETHRREGRDVPPEIIAHHYAEAGVTDRSVKYWAQAGENGARRSAHIEASHHFRRALDLLRLLPEGPERDQMEIEVNAGHSRALIAWKGYASPDVAKIFQRARSLAGRVPSDAERFRLLWDEGQYFLVKAEYRQALKHCLELAQRAASEGNHKDFSLAQLLIGGAHLYLGQLSLARDHLGRCAGIHPTPTPVPTTGTEAPEVRAPGLAYLARTVWFLGFPDLAVRHALDAEIVAEQSSVILHPTQTAGMRLLAHHLRGDIVETRACIEKTLTLASDRNHPYWIALATIVDEWLSVKTGRNGSVQGIEKALKDYAATGARLGLSGFFVMKAEALAITGALAEAFRTVQDAFTFAKEHKEDYFLPEIHRWHGCLLLARRSGKALQEAEPSFRMAIDIAQRQGALSWQLRSAISLAKLWRESGREIEAASLLGAIYGRFTEGFDTADLVEARALLDSLQTSSGGKRPDLFN